MLLLGAASFLIWNWRTLEQWERRLVTICLGSLLASLLWVPSVTPNVFVRYVIMLAPEGALLAAWLFVRGFGSYAPQFAWLPAGGSGVRLKVTSKLKYPYLQIVATIPPV